MLAAAAAGLHHSTAHSSSGINSTKKQFPNEWLTCGGGGGGLGVLYALVLVHLTPSFDLTLFIRHLL